MGAGGSIHGRRSFGLETDLSGEGDPTLDGGRPTRAPNFRARGTWCGGPPGLRIFAPGARGTGGRALLERNAPG